MERIKQAIEKLGAQQPGRTGHRHRSRLGVHGAMLAARSHDTDPELAEIAYTTTQVVKVDMDHLEKNRVVAFDKNDQRSISFDLLRTHVLQKMEENGWRTLAITSPTPESGKSVVSINLAMSIAQHKNKTAMLVDFDLRRPKIATYLGIATEKSMNDLLEGTAEVPDVLVNPDIPRLVVLPTNRAVRNSSESLSARTTEDLIADLRGRYESRIVIFDLPPVLVADDAMVLLPYIDAVLMVVANGMSTKREIEDSLRQIPADKLIGTILNKAESDPTPYYYYS